MELAQTETLTGLQEQSQKSDAMNQLSEAQLAMVGGGFAIVGFD